jgi:hypothetical protein
MLIKSWHILINLHITKDIGKLVLRMEYTESTEYTESRNFPFSKEQQLVLIII